MIDEKPGVQAHLQASSTPGSVVESNRYGNLGGCGIRERCSAAIDHLLLAPAVVLPDATGTPLARPKYLYGA